MEESSHTTNRSEIVLLAALFVGSAYMFIEAQNFDPGPARVPLIASAVTMVGVVIIAVREVLLTTDHWPEPGETSATERVEDDFETEDTDAELSDTRLVKISGLTIGYILLGYAFGLLWATPVFALGYSYIFSLTKKQTVIVLVVTILSVVMFIQLTTLNLTSGALI